MNAIQPGWPWLGLGALLLLGCGCAAHAPVSETMMFHTPGTKRAGPWFRPAGLALLYAPRPPGLVDFADEKYPRPVLNERRVFTNDRPAGGVFWTYIEENGRFAVSATLGIPVAGLDASAPLGGRNYATAAVSYPGHIQAYLQRPAFGSRYFGAALGLGYRRDAFAFVEACELLCFDVNRVWISSFVGRGTLILHREPGAEAVARLGLYAGYALQLHGPALGGSLTVRL